MRSASDLGVHLHWGGGVVTKETEETSHPQG